MARLFRNTEIYNLGYALTLEIYKITESFPEQEKLNLALQMRKSAISIPLNIAEGSTRHSDRAFLNFMEYVYGSEKELEVQLQLAKDLGYLTQETYNRIFKQLDKLMAKTFLFMSNLEKRTPHRFFRKYKEEKS